MSSSIEGRGVNTASLQITVPLWAEFHLVYSPIFRVACKEGQRFEENLLSFTCIVWKASRSLPSQSCSGVTEFVIRNHRYPFQVHGFRFPSLYEL